MRTSSNLLFLFALLAGCAAQEAGDAQLRADTQERLNQLNCPRDQTAACVERLNQPQSCYCISQDALRDLIERDNSDYARRR